MGLRPLINYLFFVFVSQAVSNCFAFDLKGSRSQINPGSQSQYSYTNAHKKLSTHNFTNISKPPSYWIQNRNRTNIKEGIYLWRNPEAITNTEATTNRAGKKSYISFITRRQLQSTTPSYIEFDYLDKDQSQNKNASLKRLHRVDTNSGRTRRNNFRTRLPFISQSSSNSYRFNDPYNVQELLMPALSKPLKNSQQTGLNPHGQAINKFTNKKVNNIKNNVRGLDLLNDGALELFSQKHDTVKTYLKDSQVPNLKSKTISNLPIQSGPLSSSSALPTPDDKVKFFEMYDTNTIRYPDNRIQSNNSSGYQRQLDNIMKINEENDSFKIRPIDNPNNTRSQRINKNFKKRSFKSDNVLVAPNQIQNSKLSQFQRSSKENSTILFSKSDVLHKTAVAQWSSYPFASVYVYKPTETHCDAAGISPHWLVAAGSCLSRHNLVHSIDERSAFVTYCGEHWRSPERIAYVKRSVVHPRFNPRDQTRRLLYNIGLIQVSSSMTASCHRWAPISLMSHQFSASPAGTRASAVGWGLDRYGSTYTSENLPHWPLTVYEAMVYHDSCPGSPTYSMEKRQEDSGASNVFCLLLPPYTGEESDPVHGGLLLVGGHLVALYLQEERRSWGSQSAQYTGVWRLLPWISDVAREPDDAEITLDA